VFLEPVLGESENHAAVKCTTEAWAIYYTSDFIKYLVSTSVVIHTIGNLQESTETRLSSLQA